MSLIVASSRPEEGVMRVWLAVLLGGVLTVSTWATGRAQDGGPLTSGAHRFEKVADGVYYATASGTMNVGANSPVIVAGEEAFVVDSEITPAAGRALAADLNAVTDKPIRYVIDSHYHYDHAFGNQVFIDSAQVIGHDNTRKRLSNDDTLRQYTYLTSVNPVPERVKALRDRIAQEHDAQQKAALERQVTNAVNYLEQVKEIRVTPPNISFDRTMTIVRGGREIRLLYLGRGHTDTDIVTYLPKERIVATGDLMESVVSYAGDSYPEEWIATLDKLKELDFDTVMPGHGAVFHGKSKITAFQSYLRDVLTQVAALRAQGLSAEEAAAKVDVTKYRDEFANIRGVGIDPAAVRRIYEQTPR
jgi:glyoxylase-like metal-dependent hydrolase (beta-lactamase superfamily II)